MRENGIFAYAKTKAQVSCAVTAQLISAFVFASKILQFLFFLNLKFQAPNHLLRLYRPVCVRPDRKPRIPFFSRRGSLNRPYVNNHNMLYFSILRACRSVETRIHSPTSAIPMS